jgi:formate dehydrogenase subunit delta
VETRPTVRLANDIAEQFEHLPHDKAVAAVAQHITSFWAPRMRRQLLEAKDDPELSPLGRDAILFAESPAEVEPLRFDTVLTSNEGTTDE